MAEVEVPNAQLIVNSISSQPSKGQEKTEKCGDMNLAQRLEIAKKNKKYQKSRCSFLAIIGSGGRSRFRVTGAEIGYALEITPPH